MNFYAEYPPEWDEPEEGDESGELDFNDDDFDPPEPSDDEIEKAERDYEEMLRIRGE